MEKGEGGRSKKKETITITKSDYFTNNKYTCFWEESQIHILIDENLFLSKYVYTYLLNFDKNLGKNALRNGNKSASSLLQHFVIVNHKFDFNWGFVALS